MRRRRSPGSVPSPPPPLLADGGAPDLGADAARLFSRVEAAALALRLLALVWGAVQDARTAAPRVPYTDVDYLVVSDAARIVLAGGSPFARATFRYSPLLAWLCVPNEIALSALIPRSLAKLAGLSAAAADASRPLAAFGKLCFCAADVVVGRLIYAVLSALGEQHRTAALCSAIFLLSPLAINVSTRGSADSLVVLLILLTIRLLLARRELWAAAAFGTAVHLRIFPIVHALPFALFLDSAYEAGLSPGGGVQRPESARAPTTASAVGVSVGAWVRALVSWRRVRFGFVSGGTFFALGGLFYALYGAEFVREAYLFHISRVDTRHNFSLFFYDLYLRGTSGAEQPSGPRPVLWGLAAFAPQLGAAAAIGSLLYRDLPLCVFAQTLAFVAFNKVITAQYFSWFLSLLPLVAARSRMSGQEAACLVAVWVAAELHWLFWAYHLELEGQTVFLGVWCAGAIFFCANVLVLTRILLHHKFRPCFTL